MIRNEVVSLSIPPLEPRRRDSSKRRNTKWEFYLRVSMTICLRRRKRRPTNRATARRQRPARRRRVATKSVACFRPCLSPLAATKTTHSSVFSPRDLFLMRFLNLRLFFSRFGFGRGRKNCEAKIGSARKDSGILGNGTGAGGGSAC